MFDEHSWEERYRSHAAALPVMVSLDSATVEVTTPPREPSVVNLTVPTPVPDGHYVLSFRVDGTQTLQPTSGTLGVSIDGGPIEQVAVEQSTAELAVDLTPGRTPWP